MKKLLLILLVGLVLSTNNMFACPVSLESSYEGCDGDSILLDSNAGPDPSCTYQWFYNGTLIPDAFEPTYEVIVSGNYEVQGSDGTIMTSAVTTVTFSPLPDVPVFLYDLVNCDDDGDGLFVFDLNLQDNIIYGFQSPAEFTLTYHITLSAAENGINDIVNTSAYNNTQNPQTIYYRLENNITGCYSIGDFDLIVHIPPMVLNPSPYELCDDMESGSNTDDISIFDLTSRIGEITGGDPLLTVTFFETLADETNDIPILNPEAYANPGSPTSIIVRVENASGCRALTSLTLVVKPTPDIDEPINLFVNDGDGDGFAIFDLTQNIPIIFSELPIADYSIAFFETQADAFTNTNPIANVTMYENLSNPQTIWVKVENLEMECYVVTSFEIETDEFDPLADEDGDGIINQDEDLNGNGNLEDDDTDGDGMPNYLDTDDDGDSVATADEITGIGAGIAPSNYIYIDTDGDGIENYLDNDDEGDETLTINEDYNNNGNPIDDDTNGNSIPDFLDDEVFLNTASQTFADLTLSPNPTSEKLTVHSSLLISETVITIFNIQGQRLFTEKAIPQNGNLEINVSGMVQGIYFVHLTTEGKMVVKKFIKE